MQFLVDECVPIEITKELQSRNFDVYDSRFKNTRGLNDAAIINLAAKGKRIIVARDLDFNLVSTAKVKPSGIILLRFRTEIKVSTIVRFFKDFLNSVYFTQCANHIIVISPSGIRIRKLLFP